MLLAVTIFLTVYVSILIPVYWKHYGPQNFLWLSDICLFLIILALWFKSPLLISMATIGMMPLEILWNIDFFAGLLTGYNLLNISNYMFDNKYTLFLRSLSLFHVMLPVICFWCLYSWGYDPKALTYQITLNSIIFITTYFFTSPQKNINWIFLPTIKNWNWMPSSVWLLILLTVYPTIIIWPMHMIIKHYF